MKLEKSIVTYTNGEAKERPIKEKQKTRCPQCELEEIKKMIQEKDRLYNKDFIGGK
jgi:hypothetical protein